MIRLRVKDMLPSKHKCSTCSNGRVTRYESGELETVCFAGTSKVALSEPVTECSDYEFRFDDATHSLKTRAWILEVKKGEVIGFKPPMNKIDKGDLI